MLPNRIRGTCWIRGGCRRRVHTTNLHDEDPMCNTGGSQCMHGRSSQQWTSGWRIEASQARNWLRGGTHLCTCWDGGNRQEGPRRTQTARSTHTSTRFCRTWEWGWPSWHRLIALLKVDLQKIIYQFSLVIFENSLIFDYNLQFLLISLFESWGSHNWIFKQLCSI